MLAKPISLHIALSANAAVMSTAVNGCLHVHERQLKSYSPDAWLSDSRLLLPCCGKGSPGRQKSSLGKYLPDGRGARP